ncbi:hypothetical protein [Methylobacterium aquaticum]|uniref:Uncharacterized protein n=1 Tax=Methylobacterium aquaticum TaxID=270351 RepID=A0A0C6F5N3_9HYPH|nr:hypothetical protein [Methylobacterium aquaticum]BAQ48066.1 hypothetical protein Maq22A_c25960 [Methylobacterium aquaticum]
MNKANELMRKAMDAVDDGLGNFPEIRIEACFDGGALLRLDEGKWIPGRFDNNIRIDQPTHLLGGDPHAHVFGRKGNELIVVNLDGSASHDMKGRLHPDDAEALRRQGFNIGVNRIVEWWLAHTQGRVVLLD